MGRVLGVDPGTKRIGVAVSDSEARVATPLSTIDAINLDADAAAIAALAGSNEVQEIIVGYPRRMDGSAGPAAERAADLAGRIEAAAVGVRVTLWDERLTSVQANKDMLSHGAKRRRRRDEADRVAATIILQSYLDTKGRA